MRLIDSMTKDELYTLKLKGMLAENHKPERTGSAPITTKMPNTVTTQYKKLKEHKGSIRYQAIKSWVTDAPDSIVDPSPIRDIYVDRGIAKSNHTGVELTIRMF